MFSVFSWYKLSVKYAAKSLQSCPTLCDPIDGSPPGSPIPGILQARTLEWVAISFSSAWKWKMKVKAFSHVRLLDCQKSKEWEYWTLSNTYLLHYWQDSKLSRLVLKIIGRLCVLSHFSHVQLCDPMDCSPPGSSVHGILQARTLEWVAISFSNAWKWKVKVKSLSHPTRSNPMDCSLPGSSIHGILETRVLEWGAIAFSSLSSINISNCLPYCVLPLYFLTVVLCGAEVFNFGKLRFTPFSPVLCAKSCLRINCSPQEHKDCLPVFFQQLCGLTITIRPLIHLKLTFLQRVK